MGVVVRTATGDDLVAVLNVFDGAALATDYEWVRDRVRAGDVLVAVPEDDPGRVLGACILDGAEITAVAVRRRRRDRGIGSTLIATAACERERLVAECDADAVPFYESLGFDVRPLPEGRYVGVLET